MYLDSYFLEGKGKKKKKSFNFFTLISIIYMNNSIFYYLGVILELYNIWT